MLIGWQTRHRRIKKKRGTVGMPKAMPRMNQDSKRRNRHRLSTLGPPLKGPPRRALPRKDHIGTEPLRDITDEPFGVAVEWISACTPLRGALKLLEAKTADVADQNHTGNTLRHAIARGAVKPAAKCESRLRDRVRQNRKV